MKLVLIALVLAVTVRAEEEATPTTDAIEDAKDYLTTPAPISDKTPEIEVVAYTNPKPAYAEKPQPPMPYKFAWAVKDEPSKNDYSHQQESDGNVVTGSYRVLLPDGRTQIVTYRADKNGYVADVKYEGEAVYPAYQPAARYPSYQPATTTSDPTTSGYPATSSASYAIPTPLPTPSTSK